jgi:alpha-galactosidase
VGTCGHEATDAASYLKWGIDFIKVDNCYYLWDNATFSNAENARYVFTPAIRSIKIGAYTDKVFSATEEGKIRGNGIEIRDDHVRNIGTFDGTGPMHSPVYLRSGELTFDVYMKTAGEYNLFVEYASGRKEGCGNWLQVAVNNSEGTSYWYDDLLKETVSTTEFEWSEAIPIQFAEGVNTIRLMNHRRQENTLASYATLSEELYKQDPGNEILLSICEWGKTQPQNWGKKVGNSWRILNDITFCVGSDGDPGKGNWKSDYTTGVTSQYNKAVVMDEFAGLDKGWNDPDMMMIGMNGLTDTMNETHMAMWCMLNSPLMLGLDLRRVEKGDKIYNVIANKELIALNQDALGIQAKRIFSTLEKDRPDTEYITNIDRVDILAKPLSDNSVAISFINVSEADKNEGYRTDVETIIKFIGRKMVNADAFKNAKSYSVKDLFTGETTTSNDGVFKVSSLKACGNVTLRISVND